MKPPIFWNRLHNAADVAQSVIGPSGAIVGTPDYTNYVYFGNGTRVNAINEYCHFDGVNMPMDEWTVEFWVKMLMGPLDGYRPCFFSNNTSTEGNPLTPGEYPLVRITYNPDPNIFEIMILSSYADWIRKRVLYTTAGFSSSGDVFHFAFTYNASKISIGADPLDCVDMYINGSIPTYSEERKGGSYDHALVAASTLSDVRICDDPWASTETGYTSPFAMENLKIYDYEKTDFLDRFNERGGMNDQIVIS